MINYKIYNKLRNEYLSPEELAGNFIFDGSIGKFLEHTREFKLDFYNKKVLTDQSQLPDNGYILEADKIFEVDNDFVLEVDNSLLLTLANSKKCTVNLILTLSDRSDTDIKELVAKILRQFGNDPGFLGSHYSLDINDNV